MKTILSLILILGSFSAQAAGLCSTRLADGEVFCQGESVSNDYEKVIGQINISSPMDQHLVFDYAYPENSSQLNVVSNLNLISHFVSCLNNICESKRVYNPYASYPRQQVGLVQKVAKSGIVYVRSVKKAQNESPFYWLSKHVVGEKNCTASGICTHDLVSLVNPSNSTTAVVVTTFDSLDQNTNNEYVMIRYGSFDNECANTLVVPVNTVRKVN